MVAKIYLEHAQRPPINISVHRLYRNKLTTTAQKAQLLMHPECTPFSSSGLESLRDRPVRPIFPAHLELVHMFPTILSRLSIHVHIHLAILIRQSYR
jgi:hypothetical protein